jgi:plastocyanin
MRRAQHSQRSSSRAALAAALAASALALTAPAALADKEIQAQPTNRFVPTNLSIDQGERVTFRNVDLAPHNVVGQDGPDGKPLFASKTIETNETAVVEGTQYLTTGFYAFRCTIHQGMVGRLEVSSAGTPLPRPAPDNTAPSLSTSLPDKQLDRVLGKGKLSVSVTLDEPAQVEVAATARVGGERVKLGSAKGQLPAGKSKLPVKLKKSARKALRGKKKAEVSIRVEASDAAGNTTVRKAKSTLH